MADNTLPKNKHDVAMTYRIKVRGQLGAEWAAWFGDLTIEQGGGDNNSHTLLIASLIDQAALHGLLRKIRDLGMTLLLVECININHTLGGMMKTILFDRYGSADVLQFIEQEKPTPKDNQVLIKVYAAAANPLDWHRMRADPFLVRLSDGFSKPKVTKLGADVAGRVEAVGKDVTQFKVGDAVFGEIGVGAFAEYAIATEASIVHKPDNISFEQAAAVPVAGLTALQGLQMGDIPHRKTVLVNGASGGVGTFAVQIAKSFGAEVTGVCSTRNLELVRSIGADHVIDYTREDFGKRGERYDLIYDANGNCTYGTLRRTLNPGGQAVIAGFTTLGHMLRTMLLGTLFPTGQNRKIGPMGVANPNQEDLLTLKALLEAGKIKAVIDKCYPLHETADAIRYLETKRARGKVVITVVSGD